MRKTPYSIKGLVSYYEPKNLSMEGGTIETAIFQEPKLLEYAMKFPKGSEFPKEFPKDLSSNDKEITLRVSQNNSGKNEIIFTGLSSTLYSRFKSENTAEAKINLVNSFRFQILLEQQSIISLVSVLETFIKSVLIDHKQKERIYHTFDKITKVLQQCEIKTNELEFLKDKKIYSRTGEIIDYAFNLRNLYVHNGGIVDKSFYKKYKDRLDLNKIGMLIRIDYNDYKVIRQWLSFYIQEICRVVEGYNDVWTDYLLSTGIILSTPTLKLKTVNGDETDIPLEDGVELIGGFEDGNNIEIVEESDKDVETFSFELDIGKMIEKKRCLKRK